MNRPPVSISFGGSPVCHFLSSTQWDTKSAIRSTNLKIIASIKKGETKQSLILEISLKNISHKEISFRDANVLIDYSFAIKDWRIFIEPGERRTKLFLTGSVSLIAIRQIDRFHNPIRLTVVV